jgi:hypothetical protein
MSLSRLLFACASLFFLVPAPGIQGQWSGGLRLVDSIPSAALVPVWKVVGKPDGGVYVGQGLDFAVKEFDEHGRLVRRLGQHGEGPGEFMDMGSFGLLGDTLFVQDTRLKRITFFGPNGEAETHNMIVQPGDSSLYMSTPQIFFGDGSVGVLPVYDAARISSEDLGRIPLIRVDRARFEETGAVGPPLATIVLLDLRPGPWIVSHSRGTSHSPQPFNDADLWVSSGDGGALYVAHRKTPNILRLSRIAPTSDTAWSQVIDLPGTAISRSMVKNLVDARRERLRQTGRRANRSEIEDRLYIPEVKSVVTHLRAGADGSVWIRLERSERLCWWGFTSSGSFMRSITLPREEPGTWLVATTATHAWFGRRDDLGLDSLFRYEFSPEPAQERC